MSRRPVVGVVTQTLEAIPGQLPPCWIMGQRYVNALRSVGAVPWVIPLLPDDPDTLEEIFQRLDAVFLTGGVDVDPSRYGETKQEFCGATDPARDAVELFYVRRALAEHKPVFAVCRGIQIVNVACGGSLYQDVTRQVPEAIKHDYFPTRENPSRNYLAHEVAVRPGSRLGGILGSERLRVNSMHHQAIKELAPGLVASAFAPDGVIEGVEGTNGHYLVAVQWHPEELADTDPAQRRLFTTFIDAASNPRKE
jgi:putative glutamine amidotransferase